MLRPATPCAATILVALILGGLAFAQPEAGAARVQQLDRRLRTDPAFKIRVLAARKLGDLRPGTGPDQAQAGEALRYGLGDPHPMVRAMAARSLARLRVEAARPELLRLAAHDPAAAVRREAQRAAAALVDRAPRPAAAPTRPPRIALGTVSVRPDPHLEQDRQAALTARISDAVEDRLDPHRPALFPRESADYRLDVVVTRQAGGPGGGEVAFEVRVVLVSMPQAHLRHSARAVARGHAERARRARRAVLEEEVALSAVAAAVDEAVSSALARR
jgi:hypothetical protein